MPYPLMFRLGQRLHGPAVNDVPGTVEAELSKLGLQTKVRPGNSIAVTCGSCRIANYPVIIKAVVDHLRRLKANPFLVPATGSDGAGTSEGQLKVLETLGIREEVIGAEIRLSVETEIIGQLPEGVPVHCNRQVLHADYTLVVGRVTLHPMFHGDVQGGLLEIIAAGLGNLSGAKHCYQALQNCPFEDLARAIHKIMLGKANLLAGLMILDNGREVTARIQAALPEDFVNKEKAMLHQARGLFPRLPFKFIDILLVDRIGTNFSRNGADPN